MTAVDFEITIRGEDDWLSKCFCHAPMQASVKLMGTVAYLSIKASACSNSGSKSKTSAKEWRRNSSLRLGSPCSPRGKMSRSMRLRKPATGPAGRSAWSLHPVVMLVIAAEQRHERGAIRDNVFGHDKA